MTGRKFYGVACPPNLLFMCKLPVEPVRARATVSRGLKALAWEAALEQFAQVVCEAEGPK